MSQGLLEKAAAVVSLLGFIYAHLDHAPCAERTARQEWISEPSPLDVPATPPRPVNLECKGHCHTCNAVFEAYGIKPACPPDEKWRREFRRLRREYRITDVERALLELLDVELSDGTPGFMLAQAIWSVFVEPWPGELVSVHRPALGVRTEAISSGARLERAELAERGVFWMADHIEGYVRAYGEKVDPVENEIRRMLADGIAERRIAKELRVGRDRIRTVKRSDFAHVECAS